SRTSCRSIVASSRHRCRSRRCCWGDQNGGFSWLNSFVDEKSLSQTASVASGVTSRRAGPVPPVVTTRQQRSLSHNSFRTERHVIDYPGMARESEQLLACCNVPDLHYITAARSQEPAIRAERHAMDRLVFTLQSEQFLPGRAIPDLHHVVFPAPRSEAQAVW